MPPSHLEHRHACGSCNIIHGLACSPWENPAGNRIRVWQRRMGRDILTKENVFICYSLALISCYNSTSSEGGAADGIVARIAGAADAHHPFPERGGGRGTEDDRGR